MQTTEATVKVQIKIVKNCLKQEHLYSDEEIHHLKKELRKLNAQRESLRYKHGFAN